MDCNITNMIFDVVGQTPTIFMIIPNKCYTENKTQVRTINMCICIINDNQAVITSTIKDTTRNVIVHNLSNCIAYIGEEQRPDALFIHCTYHLI